MNSSSPVRTLLNSFWALIPKGSFRRKLESLSMSERDVHKLIRQLHVVEARPVELGDRIHSQNQAVIGIL